VLGKLWDLASWQRLPWAVSYDRFYMMTHDLIKVKGHLLARGAPPPDLAETEVGVSDGSKVLMRDGVTPSIEIFKELLPSGVAMV